MCNKGHIPWNKGLKYSLPSTATYKYGSKNPNWKGGIATIGNCLDCGKKLKSYPAKYCLPCSMNHRKRIPNNGSNHYRWKGGKPKCIECGKVIAYKAIRCNSCANVGENNSAWRGGLSFHNYPYKFNAPLKKTIRQRDNYTCYICGNKYSDRNLDVHHIDYNKNNCDSNNLISLCKICHPKTNYNREKWLGVFKKCSI